MKRQGEGAQLPRWVKDRSHRDESCACCQVSCLWAAAEALKCICGLSRQLAPSTGKSALQVSEEASEEEGNFRAAKVG